MCEAIRGWRNVQLVRWDMSYDLGWCSTHFSGEKLKATAHVSANELYVHNKELNNVASSLDLIRGSNQGG
jgi:hypothetical protein